MGLLVRAASSPITILDFAFAERLRYAGSQSKFPGLSYGRFL